MTFLGGTSGDDGDVVVFGVPFSHGASQSAGTQQAPGILRALMRGEDSSQGIWDYGTRQLVLRRLRLADLGDFVYRASRSRRAYFEELESSAATLARNNRIPLAFGGDHSITLPLAQGVAAGRGRLQVVVIDAHHDNSPLQAESRPTHANWVSFLVRSAHVVRIIQIGVRGYSSYLPDPHEKVVECTVAALGDHLEADVPTYLSVDTDGIDPSLAPAVFHPMPEGLTWRDLDTVMETIVKRGGPVAGLDWTEYDPSFEGRNHPTGVAILHAVIRLLSMVERQRYGD